MELKNMAGLITGFVVAALLLSVLLIPVINIGTEETCTVNNTGAYFAAADDGEHTIVFSTDKITYDGTEIAYPEGFGTGNDRNATLMIGTDWMLRADLGLTRILLVGPPQTHSSLGLLADGDITATVNGSGVTFTLANNTTTTRTDLEYMIADSGDFVLCYNPYILKDSQLAGGIRTTATIDFMEIISGNVENIDSMSAEECRIYNFTTLEALTIADTTFTADTKTVAGDLLKLNKITQKATLSDDSEVTVTITYLLAPATITYNNPNYAGSGAGLLDVVPILVTVGIILGIVGLMIVRRE